MVASDHLNPDQFIDLYHHTTPENADSILKEGFRSGRMAGKHSNDVFFSDTPPMDIGAERDQPQSMCESLASRLGMLA